MASKLFHAVVGFGISLGAATVGCLGAISDSAETGGDATRSPPSNTDGDTATSPPPTTGDARAVEAAVDAGRDAIVDAAFCDAAWPTTKGSAADPRSCVDPKGECAEAGWPTACYKLAPDGTCDFDNAFATTCSAGQWQPCPSGSSPAGECK